ncbi:sugar phosphorylase [Marinifilum caeruleilacunae]|uniref:Sugar phosphorylase n=1 Tax=Marinifilum caeruleilacunae TaxID=2499076 RepID=A0ABX1WWA8_9BACT|nr:sugar phosphorylase [Marinifilum caeruleilacunae]NOU60369.1 sugar phosphorylase [Marinifilum caeruleilacunae]
MEQFKKDIQFLYPDRVDETLQEIDQIMNHYRAITPSEAFKLDEEDAILITYADSFKDENESTLQTLNKLCKKYLKEGINSIHILPFYPYTSDDGFSVVDYMEVNPDFGNWKDVAELEKSFYLMFDAVINHMSKSSDWFKGFLREDPEFENFFIEENPDKEELNMVTRPRVWPLLHKYNKNGKDAFVWTTFSEDQVDLNYANPKIFLKVLDVLLFYVSKGAKLIRLDAIAFMWKKLGTTCIHLEETHRIIQLYRKIIEQVAPQTVMITETNVPHSENISYFGNGLNEAHMVYNFSLPPLLAYSLHKENVDVLTHWAQSLQLPSDKTCFFNFTASHDGIGVRPLQGIVSDAEIGKLAKIVESHNGRVSYKSNPDGSESPYELNCNYMDLLTNPNEADDLRVKRFMLTQAVMLSMPGVPGIYYHSIFGSENDEQGVIDSGINRRINRKKLEFSQLEKELNQPGSLRSKVYEMYMKMLKVRKAEKAFDPFGEAKFYQENGVFIVERKSASDTVYCLYNFTGGEKDIEKLTEGKIDLATGNNADSSLTAYEFMWIV